MAGTGRAGRRCYCRRMAIIVRTIDPTETSAWFGSWMTAFLERIDPAAIAAEVLTLWDYRRVRAALEDSTIVGTIRSWSTQLTVPGGALLPGSAIAGVSVRPTHRRQGILRRMMAAELAGSRELGDAVALLHASEYPIYGRYGFGPATQATTWTVDTGRAHVPGAARPGAVRMTATTTSARDSVRGIFDAWRRRQAGEIWRRDFSWDDDLGLRKTSWGTPWNGFLAFHHDTAGEPDGYVRYRVDQKWEHRQPRNTLVVDEMHTLSHEAYADLWRFVLGIDLVASVRAEHRPPTERLPWLLPNARAAQSSDTGEDLWLAIVDVPRALAARHYERAGSLVIEAIHDAGTDGESRTRVLLEATRDGATCVPTDRSADLTLDIAALSAAYLGGVRLRDAVLARGVDEHRPGVLAEADALFRTADAPWCSTGF